MLHIFVVLLLLFCSLTRPEIQEEGGVPVMLGNTQMAQGDADPYTMTEVDVLPQPENFCTRTGSNSGTGGETAYDYAG